MSNPNWTCRNCGQGSDSDVIDVNEGVCIGHPAGSGNHSWTRFEPPIAYTIDELLEMRSFARGFISGWTDRPGDECIEDHWVTFSEDIDIQFWTWDPDDKDNGHDQSIHATGYRRPIVDGDQKCTDEVRLI